MSRDQKEPIIIPCGAYYSTSPLSTSLSSSSILSSDDDDESDVRPSFDVPSSRDPYLIDPLTLPTHSLEEYILDESINFEEPFPPQPSSTSVFEYSSAFPERNCALSTPKLAGHSFLAFDPPKNRPTRRRRRRHIETGAKRLTYCKSLDVRQMAIQGSTAASEGQSKLKGLKPRPYSSSLCERSRKSPLAVRRPSSSYVQRTSLAVRRPSSLFVQRPSSVFNTPSIPTSSQAQTLKKKYFEETDDTPAVGVSNSLFQVNPSTRRSKSSSHCYTGLRPFSFGSDAWPSKSSINQLLVCGSRPRVQSPHRNESRNRCPSQTDEVLNHNNMDIAGGSKANDYVSESERSLNISSRGKLEKDVVCHFSDVSLKLAEKGIPSCDDASCLRSSRSSSISCPCNSPNNQRRTSSAVSNSVTTQVIRRGQSTWEPFWEKCQTCYRSTLEKSHKDGKFSKAVKTGRAGHMIPACPSSNQSSAFQAVVMGQPIRKTNSAVRSRRTKTESAICLLPKPRCNTDRNVFFNRISKNKKSMMNNGPPPGPQKTVSEVKYRNHVARKVNSAFTVLHDYNENGIVRNKPTANRKPCYHQNYTRTRENVDELKFIPVIYNSLPWSPSQVFISSDSFPVSKDSSSSLFSAGHSQPTKNTIANVQDSSRDFKRHCSFNRLQFGRASAVEDSRTAPEMSKSYRTSTAADPKRRIERKTIISSALIQKSLEAHWFIQGPVTEQTYNKIPDLSKKTNSLQNETFGKVSFGESPKKHSPTCLSLPSEHFRQRIQSDIDQKFEEIVFARDTRKQRYNPNSKFSRLPLLSGKSINNNSARSTHSETFVKQEHSFESYFAKSGTKLVTHPSTIRIPSDDCTWGNCASFFIKHRHAILKQKKSRVPEDKEKAEKKIQTEDVQNSTDKLPENTTPLNSLAGEQSKSSVKKNDPNYPDMFIVQGTRKYFSAKTPELNNYSMTRIPKPPATDKPKLSKPAKVFRMCFSFSRNRNSESNSCAKKDGGIEMLNNSNSKSVSSLKKIAHDNPQTYNSTGALQVMYSSDSALTKVSDRLQRSTQFLSQAGTEEEIIYVNLKTETHCMTMNDVDDNIRHNVHEKSMKNADNSIRDDTHDKSIKNVNSIRNAHDKFMKNTDGSLRKDTEDNINHNTHEKSMKNTGDNDSDEIILMNEDNGIETNCAKFLQNDADVKNKPNSSTENIKSVNYGDNETLTRVPESKDSVSDEECTGRSEGERVDKMSNKEIETAEKQANKEKPVKTICDRDQHDTEADGEAADIDIEDKPDTDTEDKPDTDTEDKPGTADTRDTPDTNITDKPDTDTEDKWNTDTEDKLDHKTADCNFRYKGVGQSSRSVTTSLTGNTSSTCWEEDDEDSEKDKEESEEDGEESERDREENEEDEDDEEESEDSDEEDEKPDHNAKQTVEIIKPLSTAMMKEYCRQLKKWGGESMSMTLSKAISSWHYNYDRFSRVNHSVRTSRF